MKNRILTKICLSLLLPSFSALAAPVFDMKNCMQTIKLINNDFSFSRSDFILDFGETNFGDEKIKTLVVQGANKNYSAPKKMEDGSYFQEITYSGSIMRTYWNDKKELVKIVSSGSGSFDKPFFRKTVEFANKNGTCVPLSFYKGSSEISPGVTRGQEMFNTELCYELEKYLAQNDERKKCLDQYLPDLIKILEKHHLKIDFPEHNYPADRQASVAVYGELANCKQFKTLEAARNMALWEPVPEVSPNPVSIPVSTEKN